MNRDAILLIILLILLVAGIIGGWLWMIINIKVLLRLLLIMFLAASG